MKIATGLFVLLTVAACVLAKKQSNLPAYIECTSNNDCDPGHCCAIGQERYSYPHCQPLLGVGDTCRPGHPLLTSGTRYYPDGQVELNKVHLIVCPCADGLVCSHADGQCHVY